MSTICADAVLKVADADKHHLDLKDIQVISKVGGTLDDTELVDGLCIDQAAMGMSKINIMSKILRVEFYRLYTINYLEL